MPKNMKQNQSKKVSTHTTSAPKGKAPAKGKVRPSAQEMSTKQDATPEPEQVQFPGTLQPESKVIHAFSELLRKTKPNAGHRDAFIFVYSPKDIDKLTKRIKKKEFTIEIGDYLHLIYPRLSNSCGLSGMHYTEMLEHIKGLAPKWLFAYKKVYGMNDDYSILCLQYLGRS